MFLIQRSLYLRLKQTRHPHGIMDLYVGSFWGNRQWGYAGGSRGTFPIAFGQFFSMASVLNNAIEAWERACYNITNTSFQINYGGPILYLAIGKA